MTTLVVLTDAQRAAIHRLDAARTPQDIVQIHVDTWLAPLVQEATKADAIRISRAYGLASDGIQADVRRSLRLDEDRPRGRRE